MRKFLIFVLIVAACVFALYRWTESRDEAHSTKFTPADGPKLDYNDVHVLAAMEQEYTRLGESVVPSVVSITATKRVQAPQAEDPFELFFGRRFRSPRQTEEMRSLGSGVIVSKEGHILTNQHVVADVDEVRVRLANGQEAPARIIGVDPVTDIAVLRVTGLHVTPLAFGDSDKVKVGQRVIAVGNPFGFDETVTQGIISAKGRAMEDSSNEFFQTDAAINPGNSGGPLVDLRGQIIGINASIYAGSGSGSWQGLGFAIPANTARHSLEGIIKRSESKTAAAGSGTAPQGPELLAGVHVMEIPPDHAQDLPPHAHGVMVSAVDQASAAAGTLQQSDVIEEIDHAPIQSVSDYNEAVATLNGNGVLLSICRDRHRSFAVVRSK